MYINQHEKTHHQGQHNIHRQLNAYQGIFILNSFLRGRTTDIGMNTTDGDFSLRAAALIIKNNQLFVIKHDDFDWFYTVGGGVQVNETSTDAVIREVCEETGYRLSIDRSAFIQERFYKINNAHHHEAVFFYFMKPADVRIENGTRTDHPEEKLYWLPMDELQNINLAVDFFTIRMYNIWR